MKSESVLDKSGRPLMTKGKFVRNIEYSRKLMGDGGIRDMFDILVSVTYL